MALFVGGSGSPLIQIAVALVLIGGWAIAWGVNQYLGGDVR